MEGETGRNLVNDEVQSRLLKKEYLFLLLKQTFGCDGWFSPFSLTALREYRIPCFMFSVKKMCVLSKRLYFLIKEMDTAILASKVNCSADYSALHVCVHSPHRNKCFPSSQ